MGLDHSSYSLLVQILLLEQNFQLELIPLQQPMASICTQQGSGEAITLYYWWIM
jgi:hypothetical protein